VRGAAIVAVVALLVVLAALTGTIVWGDAPAMLADDQIVWGT
jgi:hypothetical protein